MTSSLEKYILEIKDSVLEPEEELRLIQSYQKREENWEESRDKVIKSCLMYVVKLAYSFNADGSKVQDLISEGNGALVDGIDKFDCSRGFKLITYCNFDIRGRMLKYLSANGYLSAFKVSAQTVDTVKKIKAYTHTYKELNGRLPSEEEVALHCEIAKSKIWSFLELASAEIVSIDSTFSIDGEDKALQIVDEISPDPIGEAYKREVSSIISKLIENLPLRDKAIMIKRFGLHGEEPMDLASIGLEINLTKQRIEQLEKSILARLRTRIGKYELHHG